MNIQARIHGAAVAAGLVSAAVGCWHTGFENLLLGGLLFALTFSLAYRPDARLWPLLVWSALLYAATIGLPKRAVSIGLREIFNVSLGLRAALNFLVTFWLFEGAGSLTLALFRQRTPCAIVACSKQSNRKEGG